MSLGSGLRSVGPESQTQKNAHVPNKFMHVRLLADENNKHCGA